MKENRRAHCKAGVAILKCARRIFHSYLTETKKKSTLNSYTVISCCFLTKSKENSFEIKRNLN